MNHRFLVSVSGLVVPVAVMWLATMPVAGQATSAAHENERKLGEGLHRAAHAGRPAGSAGHSGRTPRIHLWSGRRTSTKEFYTQEEALEACKKAAADEARADRTRHHRRRAL